MTNRLIWSLTLFGRSLLLRLLWVAAVLVAAAGPLRAAPADVKLAPGTSFKTVRPVYLMAVYGDARDKYKGKGPSEAFLHPELFDKTRWVAYQCKIPAGTTMTVVGPAPPARDLWRRYDAYHVKLRPDPSRELVVTVQLFRGFADASGALSADFFEPVSGPDATMPEESACTDPRSQAPNKG